MKTPACRRSVLGLSLALGLFRDAAGRALVRGGTGHPVTKVISMMQELKAKAEEEGKVEEVAFGKFQHWCKNSLSTLSKAMKEGEEATEELQGKVDSGKKEIESLTGEIKELEEQLADHDVKAADAKAVRDEEKATYAQASADMKLTIAACGEAISALQASRPAGGFLDLSSSRARRALSQVAAVAGDRASDKLGEVLRAAQEPEEPRPKLIAGGDREAHVQKYSFKSGSVIEMLKELKQDFEDELVEADKAETNAENAYGLEKQAREEAISAAQASKTEKEDSKGAISGDVAAWKGELQGVTSDYAADKKAMADTETSCTTKAQEWKERSAIRAGEIEALRVASEILAKVTGVRTEAPSNPVPPPAPLEAAEEAPASFLQVASDPRSRAVDLLRTTARTTRSKALARLAQELSVHKDDPFSAMNNMIEKMIFRLMDEQRQEDEHKMWCDQELSKTNTSMIQKEEKIEELDLKLEGATAKLQELTNEIAEADKMVAEIARFMEEATEIRGIGKKENEVAIKEAQEAQSAIAEATAVLEDFYKKSGGATEDGAAFLQRGAEPAKLGESPSTWDSSYSGVADPKSQPGGVIAVLERTASEFAEMEADTRAQEQTDQLEYDEEMKSQKIDKARREKESEMKGVEKKDLAEEIATLQKSRKHISGEHELVVQYMKDLQPACVKGDSSYEDRKAARAKETDALRQAQDILTDAFKPTAAPAPKAFLATAERHGA